MDLERKIKIKDEYLRLIRDTGYDFDGFENDIDGLKSVVETLVDYANKALDNDDTSVIYENFSETNPIYLNILFEAVSNDEGDSKCIQQKSGN